MSDDSATGVDSWANLRRDLAQYRVDCGLPYGDMEASSLPLCGRGEPLKHSTVHTMLEQNEKPLLNWIRIELFLKTCHRHQVMCARRKLNGRSARGRTDWEPLDADTIEQWRARWSALTDGHPLSVPVPPSAPVSYSAPVRPMPQGSNASDPLVLAQARTIEEQRRLNDALIRINDLTQLTGTYQFLIFLLTSMMARLQQRAQDLELELQEHSASGSQGHELVAERDLALAQYDEAKTCWREAEADRDRAVALAAQAAQDFEQLWNRVPGAEPRADRLIPQLSETPTDDIGVALTKITEQLRANREILDGLSPAVMNDKPGHSSGSARWEILLAGPPTDRPRRGLRWELLALVPAIGAVLGVLVTEGLEETVFSPSLAVPWICGIASIPWLVQRRFTESRRLRDSLVYVAGMAALLLGFWFCRGTADDLQGIYDRYKSDFIGTASTAVTPTGWGFTTQFWASPVMLTVGVLLLLIPASRPLWTRTSGRALCALFAAVGSIMLIVSIHEFFSTLQGDVLQEAINERRAYSDVDQFTALSWTDLANRARNADQGWSFSAFLVLAVPGAVGVLLPTASPRRHARPLQGAHTPGVWELALRKTIAFLGPLIFGLGLAASLMAAVPAGTSDLQRWVLAGIAFVMMAAIWLVALWDGQLMPLARAARFFGYGNLILLFGGAVGETSLSMSQAFRADGMRLSPVTSWLAPPLVALALVVLWAPLNPDLRRSRPGRVLWITSISMGPLIVLAATYAFLTHVEDLAAPAIDAYGLVCCAAGIVGTMLTALPLTLRLITTHHHLVSPHTEVVQAHGQTATASG